MSQACVPLGVKKTCKLSTCCTVKKLKYLQDYYGNGTDADRFCQFSMESGPV